MGEKAGDVELSNVSHAPPQKADFKDMQQPRRRRRRPCLACCCGCSILLVLIALVIIILALTVFKPKKPKLHVDRITIEDIDSKIELNLPPSISLNITLGLVVSVTNPNKVGFKYGNSTAFVSYRDVVVGAVPIPAGELGAGETGQIASSLKIYADRLITDPQLYSDFIASSLPFTTTSRVGGRVNVLNIFKHHVDTTTVCKVTINPLNIGKATENLDCKYNIKL